MSINTICNNLRKKGLDAQIITIHNYHGSGHDAPGIMVYHNYDGPYPSRDALHACDIAEAYARRHGYNSEQRGHYTATLIY